MRRFEVREPVPVNHAVISAVPIPLRFFFFNDTATTEIYTLSLHDALPIFWTTVLPLPRLRSSRLTIASRRNGAFADRKSTRLNSSHLVISYAVFCLKKKTVVQFASIPNSSSQ